MIKLTWQTLEDTIRSIASLRWRSPATAKHLAGVDFDAVVEPSSEERIVIEVSKRDDLAKVREDIVKINAYRFQSLADGILVRAYIVLENEPTLSMVETGKSNKVKVLSVESFLNEFFQYDGYVTLRRAQPFGSALNPFTGKADAVEYVPVHYEQEDGATDASVGVIAGKLLGGAKMVLVGDYGTGKSRCVQQVFDILTTTGRRPGTQVFAINLREHWGASSASEIIAGHLEELGLSDSVDSAMQTIRTGGAVLLLDGVDEVGAQVFGTSRESRRSIRRNALEGVRKLIQISLGGVLLTTRSHYFDSDDEMLDSTGLSNLQNPMLLRCPDEFSDSESQQYLHHVGLKASVPSWLPRKPLVFQVLATIEKEVAEEVLGENEGEFIFWRRFLAAICEREARIHGAIQAEAVRNVLLTLAQATREHEHFLGRLSVRAVREAYESVLHDSPDEAGEQMLMRLCTLARVAPTSPERQFVDEYVIDGLRAESFLGLIESQDRTFSQKKWRQPLTRLGWHILRDSLVQQDKFGGHKAALAALARGGNDQALSELLSALLSIDGSQIDVDADLRDCDVYLLTVGQRPIKRLRLTSSYVRSLDIAPTRPDSSPEVHLSDCQILEVFGVSSQAGLPKWIEKSDVDRYESLSNANRIKVSDLSPAHTLFLAVIHKIFFQRGTGREEKALLKGGFGQQYEPKLLVQILNLLIREKIIRKFPGADGPVYAPIREHTRRMAAIKNQLTLSGDPLWVELETLNKN